MRYAVRKPNLTATAVGSPDMLFAIVFFLNSATNFALGIVLSALLGPAEFGRYATVALAAITLAGAVFDWLRYSTLRFVGEPGERAKVASSLEASYLGVMALLALAVILALATGLTFGLTPSLLAVTPLLAIALNRVDFAGAQFRACGQDRAFAALFGLRQLFTFTLVIGIAYFTRDATLTVVALAFASLAAAIALLGPLRTPGARLSLANRGRIIEFLVYAKPIVASLVVYQLIALINRQVALDHLGAVATGKLSLATDLGQRLFQAVSTLPEFLLFQYALERERAEGRAAAQRQIGVNMALALALLAPLAGGYMAMAPTFEALLVPSAYRGEFARLTLFVAPGFLAYCLISSALNPVFQLARRTWPVTLASLVALATDLALLRFGGLATSVESLALANAISLAVGLLVAAGMALREPASRPRARDVAAVVAATLAMSFGVRPLNGVGSPALAAAAAVVGGGAFYGATLLVFDVAGLRTMAAAWLRAPRGVWSAPPPSRS
jgi:O-antigen/teichoic acid export membrane protein